MGLTNKFKRIHKCFLEFSNIKKGLNWPNIKIKRTKIKRIGPAGPEVQAHFFIFLCFSFFELGMTILCGARLGPASLASSLAQASDQPGQCACMHELLTHALHSDKVIILRAGKNKRGYLVQLEAKLALGDEDDGEAGGSMLLPSSVLSLVFLLSVFCFLCFFAFSVFVSLFVFSMSNHSSVRSFSSPVRPCVSLVECPISSAVAFEDGALELLLKAKYNSLTLCFSLSFVRPLSLCVSLRSLFFSLYWFSCSWSHCFFFRSPSLSTVSSCFQPLSSFFIHDLSIAFIRPENAMRSKLGNGMHHGGEK